MSVLALTFLVLVGGFVWGGFLLLLVRAVRSEAAKAGHEEHGATGS